MRASRSGRPIGAVNEVSWREIEEMAQLCTALSVPRSVSRRVSQILIRSNRQMTDNVQHSELLTGFSLACQVVMVEGAGFEPA